jgi:predicted transcriptional regulator
MSTATANKSIKLDASEIEKINQFAIADNRTPHFIMKEAIRIYLKRREVEKQFIDVAIESRKHYKATGLHITHQEFTAWVAEVQKNPNTPMPVCHK